SGFKAPSVLLKNDSVTPVPRFPRPGPRERRSPASSVLSEHYDFLRRIRIRLWIRSLRSNSLSPGLTHAVETAAWCGHIYIAPCLGAILSWLERRISQVPGESILCLCPALRLRSVRLASPERPARCSPHLVHDEDTNGSQISELNDAASTLVAYAS